MTLDLALRLPWPAMGSSDREAMCLLAREVAAGDPGALARLYDRCARDLHGLALWRTGSALEADDVVQDVFVRLASDPGRLAGTRDPRAYLLSMAHHAAVDRVRQHRPSPQSPLLTTDDPDPTRGLDAERAAAALTSLPPAQREAIYLHHFAGLGFREISAVTGVPTFTAASRYRLGIARLRRALGVRG
jgi:RNA polymerase sigma-70 factor (ECF subfamily)